MELSEEQLQLFERDGFLVIPDFFSPHTVSILRNKIAKILHESDLFESRTVFTTKEQDRATDEYFLSSGDKIRFFWEADAWSEDGKSLKQSPELSINKIGHNLHDLDSDFTDVSYDSRLGTYCRQLGQLVPLVVQSMYIFKQPRIGGEVGGMILLSLSSSPKPNRANIIPSAHQDGAFLYTEPQTCIGFWWALDNCTTKNGCLWAVPGSHKLGVCRRFRRKDAPGQGTEFCPAVSSPGEGWDLSNAVPVEVAAGTLVILHSAVVHYSEENKSDVARHAYSIHVVDGREGVIYPADNWLQRPAGMPFKEISKFTES